jgi:hypothetical protein
MQYIVIKPFQDISGFKEIGSSVELDDWRAAKLRRMGLIGGRYEQPTQMAEKETAPNFEDMTKKELLEYASSRGIKIDERMTKKQIAEELI